MHNTFFHNMLLKKSQSSLTIYISLRNRFGILYFAFADDVVIYSTCTDLDLLNHMLNEALVTLEDGLLKSYDDMIKLYVSVLSFLLQNIKVCIKFQDQTHSLFL